MRRNHQKRIRSSISNTLGSNQNHCRVPFVVQGYDFHMISISEIAIYADAFCSFLPCPDTFYSLYRKKKSQALPVAFSWQKARETKGTAKMVYSCAVTGAIKMKKMPHELWGHGIRPPGNLISDNPEYRELQHRQLLNTKISFIHFSSDKQCRSVVFCQRLQDKAKALYERLQEAVLLRTPSSHLREQNILLHPRAWGQNS